MKSLVHFLWLAPILTGCNYFSNAAEKPAEGAASSAAASAVPKVATIKAERKSLKRTTAQPGEIRAFEAAPLYAKASGYIEKVHVDIGDPVKQGDLLVTLSIPEMQHELKGKAAQVTVAESGLVQSQAAVKVAEAAIKTAEARLGEAQTAVDRAEAEYQRWKSESQRVAELAGRSAVTPKLADETRSQFRAADAGRKEVAARIESATAGVAESRAELESAAADVTAAEARIQLANAELEQTQALAAYAEIHAPFDGHVAQRNVDTGHFIPATAGANSKPLVVIVRADVVRVFCDVPEMDAGLTDPGDAATIRIQALSNRTIAGQVTRTAAALDESVRTLRTEIDLPNPQGELKPGMYVNVMLTIAERADVLAVPTSAVFVDEGKPTCAVVEGGHVVRKPLELGLQAGAEVEVLSGLNPGEQVIAKGAAGFAPGQSVEILPPEPRK